MSKTGAVLVTFSSEQAAAEFVRVAHRDGLNTFPFVLSIQQVPVETYSDTAALATAQQTIRNIGES